MNPPVSVAHERPDSRNMIPHRAGISVRVEDALHLRDLAGAHAEPLHATALGVDAALQAGVEDQGREPARGEGLALAGLDGQAGAGAGIGAVGDVFGEGGGEGEGGG